MLVIYFRQKPQVHEKEFNVVIGHSFIALPKDNSRASFKTKYTATWIQLRHEARSFYLPSSFISATKKKKKLPVSMCVYTLHV